MLGFNVSHNCTCGQRKLHSILQTRSFTFRTSLVWTGGRSVSRTYGHVVTKILGRVDYHIY